MKNLLFCFCAAVALSSASLWLSACQKDTADTDTATQGVEVTDRANANSKVFPRTARPYGMSYTDWTVLFQQTFMSFDCDNIPFFNPENVLFYQTGPVYFMAGIMEEGASADITVPHGKAILFPLANYINDYPCPDPNFEPAPGQSLEDFLAEGAVWFTSNCSNISVSIDGDPVSNPANYLFTSDLFQFTGNADLADVCGLDACVTGEVQDAVTSGYYIMLKPLSYGLHTVHYHLEMEPWGIVQDGTFNITVE